MDDNAATWTDVAGLFTATISTVIAIVAVVVAIRTDRRSREVLKIQTYLTLRTRFLDLYQKLGKLEEESVPDDVTLRLAREAYWHHCWDEWYISERLSPAEFGDMWKRFFAVAALSGLRHPALNAALAAMTENKAAGLGRYGTEFLAELQRIENEARADDARLRDDAPHVS